jgi:hypothetical protein
MNNVRLLHGYRSHSPSPAGRLKNRGRETLERTKKRAGKMGRDNIFFEIGEGITSFSRLGEG